MSTFGDLGSVQAFALAKLPQEVFRDALYVIVSAGEYVVDQDDYVEDGSPLLYEWCPKCKGGFYKQDGTVVEIDLLKEYL